jgi:hypothetical protein
LAGDGVGIADLFAAVKGTVGIKRQSGHPHIGASNKITPRYRDVTFP